MYVETLYLYNMIKNCGPGRKSSGGSGAVREGGRMPKRIQEAVGLSGSWRDIRKLHATEYCLRQLPAAHLSHNQRFVQRMIVHLSGGVPRFAIFSYLIIIPQRVH